MGKKLSLSIFWARISSVGEWKSGIRTLKRLLPSCQTDRTQNELSARLSMDTSARPRNRKEAINFAIRY